MTITIRFDGYPLYAFVPEWMVITYTIGVLGVYLSLRSKYNG